MKEKIIRASIESLREEGLKFSVDTLAEKLKISKKTVYKYFPDKEALALALYETYYKDAKEQASLQAKKQIGSGENSARSELLHIYFESKMMTRREIYNKYKLNETVYSYTSEQNNMLWEMISAFFWSDRTKEEKEKEKEKDIFRIIVDGAFEKLCDEHFSPDGVIERLVLWL